MLRSLTFEACACIMDLNAMSVGSVMTLLWSWWSRSSSTASITRRLIWSCIEMEANKNWMFGVQMEKAAAYHLSPFFTIHSLMMMLQLKIDTYKISSLRGRGDGSRCPDRFGLFHQWDPNPYPLQSVVLDTTATPKSADLEWSHFITPLETNATSPCWPYVHCRQVHHRLQRQAVNI